MTRPITVEAVKALREKSGSGLRDCQEAIRRYPDNEEHQLRWLREKGHAIVRSPDWTDFDAHAKDDTNTPKP